MTGGGRPVGDEELEKLLFNRVTLAKSGRTTGCTQGVIIAINATTVINYPPQARFTRQILIGAEPNRIACVGPDPAGAQIAAPGDSGSLWVTNDPRIKDRNGNRAAVPVGLLFASRAAAPGTVVVANPIRDVLTALGVELVAKAPPVGNNPILDSLR